MKTLHQYIKEKLIINKDYRDNMIVVKTFDELRKIIEDRYDKLGAGTKRKPIDFNDIDVSNLDSFCGNDDNGLFEKTKFKYIDITYWDVSNVYSTRHMFYGCKKLESVGDISKWDVSNVRFMPFMFSECKKINQDLSSWNVSKAIYMNDMFYGCKSFNQDLSKWNVSSVIDMSHMFGSCESFNQDLSNWDVSNVINMSNMFFDCKSFNQDLSNWNVYKVKFNRDIFKDCPIKEEYKPKFK